VSDQSVQPLSPNNNAVNQGGSPAEPRGGRGSGRFRLLGHPAHPPLTDFPIALLSISVVWDMVGLFSADPVWRTMALWCLIAGMAAVIPTAMTGLVDFVAVPEGRPVNLAIWHMSVMLTASGFFGGSLIVRLEPHALAPHRATLALGLSLFGLVLLMVGGWIGGELVFGHGVGVRAPDEPDRKRMGNITEGK
jgi:uncharacterized membrane protein